MEPDVTEEDEVDDGPSDPNPGDACHNLLKSIQTEPILMDDAHISSAPSEATDDLDPAFENMPDKDLLAETLQQPADELASAKTYLPSTLLEALLAKGCPWNALWRFIVRLRSAKGGCDLRWIPNPINARRSSSKLNWHQWLGFTS